MKKEDALKFYQSYKFYIFPAVVVVSSLFLILFAIYPQTTKLLKNQQTVESLSVKSKFLDSKASALERYEGANLPQKVEVALKSFPVDRDYGNIFSLLQQLTADSGFTINTISISNASNKTGGAESFIVQLEIKGSKLLLQNLLNNIESSPRLVRVNNIAVSNAVVTQISSVSLSVEVLYSQLPQNFGATDSPVPELTDKDEGLLNKLAKTGVSTQQAPTAGFQSSRGKVNPFE